MKNKLFILLLLTLIISPVFAKDYDDDFYEEGDYEEAVPASTSQPIRKNIRMPQPEKKENLLFPRLDGRILTEYYINNLLKDKERISLDDKKTNGYLYTELDFKLRFTKGISLTSKWYLEPVDDRLYTGDIYAENPNYIIGNANNNDFYGKEDHIKRKFHFWDYGLGIETLNISYEASNIALGIGKFNPSFGSAFEKSRFSGIYGTVLPEEYELTEKIGGYISALLPFGNITFNLFFNDETDLSGTMFRKTGKNKAEGTVGNTNKLNNYSLTFNGNFETFKLNLGFRQQYNESKNNIEEVKETGYVAGLEYLIELDYNIVFKPLAELTYITNYMSMENRKVLYGTLFLPIMFENWHLMFSGTIKYDKEKNYDRYNTYLAQISFGYKFDIGLMIDFARIWGKQYYKADTFDNLGKDGEKWETQNNSWAFMISYVYKFSI